MGRASTRGTTTEHLGSVWRRTRTGASGHEHTGVHRTRATGALRLVAATGALLLAGLVPLVATATPAEAATPSWTVTQSYPAPFDTRDGQNRLRTLVCPCKTLTLRTVLAVAS